ANFAGPRLHGPHPHKRLHGQPAEWMDLRQRHPDAALARQKPRRECHARRRTRGMAIVGQRPMASRREWTLPPVRSLLRGLEALFTAETQSSWSEQKYG